MSATRKIDIGYRAVDGAHASRHFLTVAGARRYAHKMVGATPELGRFYAVSDDGVGRVFVVGITWEELFPALFPTAPEVVHVSDLSPLPAWSPADLARVRAAGHPACVCTDAELQLHGCSCWDPY